MTTKPKLSKAELEHLYFTQELSMGQIARRVGVNSGRIAEWFSYYAIPARSKSQAVQLRVKNGSWHGSSLRGEQHHWWNGGRWNVSPQRRGGGYNLIKMPAHPRAMKSGYVLEHIYVWETVHNQRLPDGYIIHHINGISTDNRPENLAALPSKAHYNILQVKAERIRALEARVAQLEHALRQGQMLFTIGEN